MYKQYISSILIIALLLQFGCYSGKEITIEEVITSNEINELSIITRDSLNLIFEKPEFYVIDDTLRGKGIVVGSHSQLSDPFDWNIPLSDIITAESIEFDGTKTLIFIGATILGVGVLFCLFILASGGIDAAPSGSW